MTARALRIATRGSPLALAQAERVAAYLAADAEIVVVKTEGDRRTDEPLRDMAGRGVFTTEVQVAVLDGRADLAVHSAKDLPASASLQVEGLVIAAVPERADVRDCLVGSTLDGLAPGATVGTGSPRRQALLEHLRPDLNFVGLRGNIATRLARVGELAAIVGAVAALTRLGLADQISEAFDPSTFVPQVGQGALAVECRVDDAATLDRVAAIDDSEAHRALLAERAFLATLGGGCDAPVGAYARVDGGELSLVGFMVTDFGPQWATDTGGDPRALGEAVANAVRGGRA
ncbi:MAG: hydroxymethylbilane synthase [Actinomycetota bacterium]